MPVLITVHTSTVFVEPFRIAQLLAASGFQPVFVFAYEHWTVAKYTAMCHAAGFRVCAVGDTHSGDGVAAKFRRRVAAKLRLVTAVAARRWPVLATVFLHEFLELRASLARASVVFDEVRPHMLILSIDLAGYDSGAYLKVARSRGCRSLLISSIMSIEVA